MRRLGQSLPPSPGAVACYGAGGPAWDPGRSTVRMAHASWGVPTPMRLPRLASLGQTCYCPGPCYASCHSTASWCRGGQVQVGCTPVPAAAPVSVVPVSVPTPTPSPSPILPATTPTTPRPIAPILTAAAQAVAPLIYSGGRSFDVATAAANGSSSAPSGSVATWPGWPWAWIAGGGLAVVLVVVVARRRRRRRVA